jgi:hypothetical protein
MADLDYEALRARISAGYLAYLRDEQPTGDVLAGAVAAFTAIWWGRELQAAVWAGADDRTIAWLSAETKGCAQAAEGCDKRWAHLAVRILANPAATACFLAGMPAEVLDV